MIYTATQKPGLRFKEGDVINHPDYPASEFVVERSSGCLDYEGSSCSLEIRELNPDGSYNPEGRELKVTEIYDGDFRYHRAYVFMPKIEVKRKLKRVYV